MHFISGLPRAGSTLLAALLRQNPACHAGITSPLGAMVNATREFDARLGTPGLHDVRPRVGAVERKTILPPDLWERWERQHLADAGVQHGGNADRRRGGGFLAGGPMARAAASI